MMKGIFGLALCATAIAVAAAVAIAATAPVQVAFVRMDQKKEVLVYSVTIAKDAKPMHQVDLHFRYLDAAGKEIKSDGFLWQNITKSKRNPIEAGKSYEDTDGGAPDNCARAEISVVRIHYDDGSVGK